MINKLLGIDRYKKYSTITELDRKGEKIDFEARCFDLKGYIDNLGPGDEEDL